MTAAQPARTEVSACELEPIRVPGSIQPHGVLMVLDQESLSVAQVSLNTEEMLGLELDLVLGKSLKKFLDPADAESLGELIAGITGDESAVHLNTLKAPVSGRIFSAVANRFDGELILELELSDDLEAFSFNHLYPMAINFPERLRGAQCIEEIALVAASEIRRVTQFERVVIYKFEQNWNGHVVAESKVDDMPSLLDLWFPAADIPSQVRALYEFNRMRVIVDSASKPVPLFPSHNPRTKRPLDLSMSVLRSVSPTHIQYLKNMGVGSSLSISLLGVDRRLWGLINCHHRTPRQTPLAVRTACDVMARMLANQVERVEMIEQQATFTRKLELRSLSAELLEYMAQDDDFVEGLTKHPAELLSFAEAQGAAIVYRGHCRLIGACPSEDDVWTIVNTLSEYRKEMFHTDCAASVFPNGEALQALASGVLAISFSKVYTSYLIWFRPETVKTIRWGGNPRKFVLGHDGVPRPRTSFEVFTETLNGASKPWTSAELDAAIVLRNGIIGIVLKRAEESAQLSAELHRSNKELEAFSYSVSHDLRAPFRHIVGYAELLLASASNGLSNEDKRYIDVIIDSAHFAGTLVDNLLSFSQVGRATLRPRRVSMGALVNDVRRDLVADIRERKVIWKIGSFPDVFGDPMMLKLVLQNLLENALKYTRKRAETVIEIGWDSEERDDVFFVKDNGVGFEQAYAGKLFGMFQRLHRVDEYEGTGIGLANVRALVARHGGRTWAQGELDRGATFYFSLPKKNASEVAGA